ncbi:hypothetical protein O0L34_g2257 [Tuta absoluta]|nr:hypothetical protein O0L34_g2257 [Tuta absoluta]
MSNKSDGYECGKVFISEAACKKINREKNRDIFVHEVNMRNKKGWEELKGSTEAMSGMVTRLLQSVPQVNDTCHCEREAVTNCYVQQEYQGLNCAEEVKQFVECAKERSEAVVRNLAEQQQCEDQDDDDDEIMI